MIQKNVMRKFVIIHGTGGSPEGNWFPWLAAKLREQGAEVLLPRMPTPEGQSLTTWLKTFANQVGSPDRNTTIIGHSIGATCLLRILETLEEPIAASVFVAGLTGRIDIPEFDTLNQTFIEKLFDWQKIRANAGRVLCFSGDDDPYVPLQQGREIAARLLVQLILVPRGGHLNAASGFLAFPLLLEQLNKIGDGAN